MSGWTALTINFKESEDAEEYLAEVKEELQEFESIFYSDSDIIKVTLEGYGRHSNAVQILHKLKDRLADHQVVIDANDTTDSGDGTVYRVYEFGSTGRVDVYPTDQYQGEQPEVGHDVAVKIQNEYDFDFVPYTG